MQNLPKIWFLRHGETHWNKARRIQGQLESDLTAQGIEHAKMQARLMGSVLAGKPACFVSPLGRAQQTAKIALGGVSYQTDARLAEVHVGDWQGMLRDEVRRDFTDPVAPKMNFLEMSARAPGGEGFAALEARTRAFLKDLKEPSVVVAHGIVGQVLRGIVRGLNRDEMGQLSNQQGCIYVLEDGAETILR